MSIRQSNVLNVGFYGGFYTNLSVINQFKRILWYFVRFYLKIEH